MGRAVNIATCPIPVTVAATVIVQRGECHSPLRVPVVCVNKLLDYGGDVAGDVRTDPLWLIADADDGVGVRIRGRVRGRVKFRRRGELHSPFWAGTGSGSGTGTGTGSGAGAGAGGRPAGPVVHSEPRHEAGAFGAAEALGSRASPANIAPS